MTLQWLACFEHVVQCKIAPTSWLLDLLASRAPNFWYAIACSFVHQMRCKLYDWKVLENFLLLVQNAPPNSKKCTYTKSHKFDALVLRILRQRHGKKIANKQPELAKTRLNQSSEGCKSLPISLKDMLRTWNREIKFLLWYMYYEISYLNDQDLYIYIYIKCDMYTWGLVITLWIHMLWVIYKECIP